MVKKIDLKYIVLVLNIVVVSAYAQIISTYAGNGIQGWSGDGGYATAAELYNPEGLFINSNLYIADFGSYRIRKIDPTGIISIVAGGGNCGPVTSCGDGGPATSADLFYPSTVTVDDVGNIYIADSQNSFVRKVNTLGIITTIAGQGTPPNNDGFSGDGGMATMAKLGKPTGIAIDKEGNIFIADFHNDRIRKIDSSGIITTIAGNGGSILGDGGLATNASLSHPSRVVFDKIGNLFITDLSHSRIRKIDTLGIITTVVGNGVFGFSGDSGQATLAQLNSPQGIAIDTLNNLYIADAGNNRIRKVDKMGIITTIAGNGTAGYGGDGGDPLNAELNNPSDIVVDNIGNLFISDYNNNRIRKISNVTYSIKQLNYSDFHIWPNPCSQFLKIKIQNQLINAVIYNILGKEILIAKDTEIDISNIPDGVYFIHVKTNADAITQKIIVRH